MSDFKLYEISHNYTVLLDLLEDESNADLDFSEALDGIVESAEEKITNTAGLIKMLEDNVELIKKREKELADMRKINQNRIERIKEYLLEHMIKMDIKKVDNGTRVVRYQNNAPSLEVTNIKNVPEEFVTYSSVLDVKPNELPKEWQEKVSKTDEKVDKRGLLNYVKGLEEDEYKDYAKISQTKSLRIK